MHRVKSHELFKHVHAQNYVETIDGMRRKMVIIRKLNSRILNKRNPTVPAITKKISVSSNAESIIKKL